MALEWDDPQRPFSFVATRQENIATSDIEYVKEQKISPRKKSPNSTGYNGAKINLMILINNHLLVETTLSQYGIIFLGKMYNNIEPHKQMYDHGINLSYL